jgi:hypothetical protein
MICKASEGSSKLEGRLQATRAGGVAHSHFESLAALGYFGRGSAARVRRPSSRGQSILEPHPDHWESAWQTKGADTGWWRNNAWPSEPSTMAEDVQEPAADPQVRELLQCAKPVFLLLSKKSH